MMEATARCLYLILLFSVLHSIKCKSLDDLCSNAAVFFPIVVMNINFLTVVNMFMEHS